MCSSAQFARIHVSEFSSGFLICVPLRDEWQNEEGVHIPEPPAGSGEEFVYQVGLLW